jgi:hypothetical protein
MMFLRRTLIASAAFAMLAAAPALAVDYGRWFFSTANDPKPAPFSTCVSRAQAAMATQGFGARVGGTNPAYLDATTGLVSVTAFCVGQPKGFYYILVVMSDDGSKSALSVGNAINAAFFGSDASAGSGGSAATGAGGTWQLTSDCKFVGSGWQSTLDLTQAAGGVLTGMVRNDPLTPVVVGGQLTGTTMTLTLRPADWADNMQLTGDLSGGKIAGKVHHLGADDCTFSMVRTASSSA